MGLIKGSSKVPWVEIDMVGLRKVSRYNVITYKVPLWHLPEYLGRTGLVEIATYLVPTRWLGRR